MKNSVMVLLFALSIFYAKAAENVERFITEDFCGLATDFQQINSSVPFVEEKYLSFEEGREWRQHKILEMRLGISNKTLASKASEQERGFLLLALSCSYFGAGGIEEVKNEIFFQACNLLSGTTGNDWEKRLTLINNIADLVKAIYSINGKESKDFYDFSENECFYKNLLRQKFIEYKALFEKEHKENIPIKIQKFLKKTHTKVTLLLKNPPRK